MQLCLTVLVTARSFLASFQQMGTDEKAAQIIARVVEGKLLLWPQTFASVPPSMSDQSYNLTHAGLVKVRHPFVAPFTSSTSPMLAL